MLGRLYTSNGVYPGSYEVQSVTCAGAVTADTFTLTFQHETTAAIAYTATATQIANSLIALTTCVAECGTAFASLSDCAVPCCFHSVGDVSVSFVGAATQACSSGGNSTNPACFTPYRAVAADFNMSAVFAAAFQVTFLNELGNVPVLIAQNSVGGTLTLTVTDNIVQVRGLSRGCVSCGGGGGGGGGGGD